MRMTHDFMYRCDMEPPDVDILIDYIYYHFDSCITVADMNVVMKPKALVKCISSNNSLNSPLKLRGGGGDVNHDKSYNQIPYLNNIAFEWNGLPSIDFNERVLYPLNNGLDFPYASLVGALLYISVTSRPDYVLTLHFILLFWQNFLVILLRIVLKLRFNCFNIYMPPRRSDYSLVVKLMCLMV